MKSYTDIEQSKKLVEILSIESADMIWRNENINTLIHYTIPFHLEEFEFCDLKVDLPCWSLSALLDILPTGKVLLHDKWNHGYKCICNNIDSYYFNNPIDACYEMILKLHKLNLL